MLYWQHNNYITGAVAAYLPTKFIKNDTSFFWSHDCNSLNLALKDKTILSF